MHDDYASALYLVGGLLFGAVLSLVFGLWLIGALVWGKPSLTIWCLGLTSWGCWAFIAGRLIYMRITGHPL